MTEIIKKIQEILGIGGSLVKIVISPTGLWVEVNEAIIIIDHKTHSVYLDSDLIDVKLDAADLKEIYEIVTLLRDNIEKLEQFENRKDFDF
jgi:hypothetical protein